MTSKRRRRRRARKRRSNATATATRKRSNAPRRAQNTEDDLQIRRTKATYRKRHGPAGTHTEIRIRRRGRPQSETDPEGNKRTWEYNEDSQETSTVSPRGNVEGGEPRNTRPKSNATHRAARSRSPTRSGTQPNTPTTPTATSKRMTDANGHTTTYTYDADNEQTKVEEPNKADHRNRIRRRRAGHEPDRRQQTQDEIRTQRCSRRSPKSKTRSNAKRPRNTTRPGTS